MNYLTELLRNFFWFSLFFLSMNYMKTRTPLLFIGHGSPMNAIESNTYTESWRKISTSLEKPRAVLVFSAHWITQGETRISSAETPEMIYDMYGFPPELYRFCYPARGSTEIAEEIVSVMSSGAIAESRHLARIVSEKDFSVSKITETDFFHSKWQEHQTPEKQWKESISSILDPTRGLDHGVWSVLTHIFPDADVPVISMSLDYRAHPRDLYELGESLAILRDKWILIMWSGNIVHNLGALDWSGAHAYPWAIEYDQKIAHLIETRDYATLCDSQNWGDISRLAHPSHDHLLPLFPLIGASTPEDTVTFSTPDIVMGSISMRSVRWG